MAVAGAKAALNGAAKVTGIAGEKLRERAARDEVLNHVRKIRLTAPVFPELNYTQLQSLEGFLASAEAEQYCLYLAASLHHVGGKADQLSESDLLTYFRRLIHDRCGITGTSLADVAQVLHTTLQQQVAVASRQILHGSQLPKEAQMGLFKIAASLAAAMTRDSKVKKNMDRMIEIKDFESQYLQQYSRLYSTMRLPHTGASRSVPYERLFVAPRLLPEGSDQEITGVSGLLETRIRTVVLGNPGGGKSTAVQHFSYQVATNTAAGLQQRVPFFITLRDYAPRFAADKLSIVEYIEASCRTPLAVAPPEGAVEELIATSAAVVIFDGLDELLDTSLRRDMVEAVEGFAFRYPTTPLVVTSRRIGYEEAPLDNLLFPVSQLQEFTNGQVSRYAQNWFTLDDSIPPGSSEKMANAFLGESRFVRDLSTNPLMLALMCGLYSTEGYIPKNRPDVYEKCSELLFDTWDRHRGIDHALPFDAHLRSAIAKLALWLYPQSKRLGLPRPILIKYMTDYLLEKRFDNADDAEDAATSFIDFCRGRAWVLTDVGHELYWFTHGTFLEFFAAVQLVRTHASADLLIEALLPRILRAEWDVVAQLAIQKLGKTVEDGADDFLIRLLAQKTSDPVKERNLVSFACRLLEFVVPRASLIEEVVWRALEFTMEVDYLGEPPILELRQCSPENLPLVSKYLSQALTHWSSNDKGRDDVLIAVALFKMLGQSSALAADGVRKPRVTLLDAAQTRECLSSSIERARVNVGWFAAMEVLAGHLDPVEMLRTHGVNAIFECKWGRWITGNPPVLALLGQRSQVDRVIADALISTLEDLPTPWLQPGITVGPLIRACHELPPLTVGPRFDAFDSLRLLLTLAIIELDELLSTADHRWSANLSRRTQRKLNSPRASETDDELKVLQSILISRWAEDVGELDKAVKKHMPTRVQRVYFEWRLGHISLIGGSRTEWLQGDSVLGRPRAT